MIPPSLVRLLQQVQHIGHGSIGPTAVGNDRLLKGVLICQILP